MKQKTKERKLMKYIKKLFCIITCVALVLTSVSPLVSPAVVSAAPARPGTPDTPDTPDLPDTPEQPQQPDQPRRPGDPTPTPTPQPEGTSQNTSGDTPSVSSPAPVTTTSTGGTTESDSQGDTSIETGNANAVGTITTNANTNLASAPGGGSGGTSAVNNDNGQNSTNTNTIDNQSTTALDQNNSATVKNTAGLSAVSGDNSISDNINGNVSIETGAANTSLTAVTNVNTNIAGADIVEFNVVDDHVGNLILDFSNPCATGGCIAGTPLYLANTSNGQDSTNTNDITNDTSAVTVQDNSATIENNLNLSSDSGSNNANDNIGGDVAITTGDANTSANVINMANNNFAGNVLVGVVNIFGDLIGNIIFPEQQGSGGGSGTYAANLANGVDSQNFNNIDQSVVDEITQNNTATIDNNINLAATTGDNAAKDNIGGDANSIDTGNANVVASVLNIANTNIVGGNWWVVLVNEAGNWIGHIVGGGEGANYAGSAGTQFVVNPDGSITASNGENLEGSTNTNNLTSSTTNTTTQTNNATIVNNLDLSANTGGNHANDNIGGNTSIETGDANVVANVVNFLNNNFVGGKVYLTVVNVFGSWVGDFVGPGQTQELASNNSQTLTLGGTQNSSSSNSGNNSSSAASNQSNSDESQVQAALASQPLTSPAQVLGNKVGQFLSFQEENPEDPELGVQAATTAAKKVININLAIVIPLLLAYFALRYHTKLAALLPRRK